MQSFFNRRVLRDSYCADGAFAITPGASALSNPTTGGILVGAAGTLTCTIGGVGGIVITAIAGQYLNVVATHVTAATATGLVGLYHR